MLSYKFAFVTTLNKTLSKWWVLFVYYNQGVCLKPVWFHKWSVPTVNDASKHWVIKRLWCQIQSRSQICNCILVHLKGNIKIRMLTSVKKNRLWLFCGIFDEPVDDLGRALNRNAFVVGSSDQLVLAEAGISVVVVLNQNHKTYFINLAAERYKVFTSSIISTHET